MGNPRATKGVLSTRLPREVGLMVFIARQVAAG